MSYKYSVLVAGSGETSRANVEALMEDHYHANGDNGLVVIAFDKRPSSGQIWAAQVASSRKLDVLIVSPPDCSFDNIPKSSYVESSTPYKTAIDHLTKGGEAFILWSDDDPSSLESLAECKAAGIPAMDLCNGLVQITPASDIEVPRPVEMPTVEKEISSKPLLVQEVIETEEEEESEDDDSEEEEDPLYSALLILADYVAEAVVERLKEQKWSPQER